MKDKGVFFLEDNGSIIENGNTILTVNDIPRYKGNHKYKCFTSNGRRFKVIYAHAGYPWLWKEIGF